MPLAPASRSWCSSAAKSSAAPASPRRSGPAARSPPRPTSTACSGPRSSGTSSSSGTGSRCCRAVHRRSRPFPDGRSLLLGPDKALTHREVSKFSRKDADALPKYEAMLERVADFLEPTLVQTPPNPWSLPAGEPDAARQAGARVSQARPRGPAGRRDPDRGGHADSRPLVRVGAAQGDARDRRDHRCDGLTLHARDGLRAVPPRDGRVRRGARRLGLRARRHGGHQQRDRPAPRGRRVPRSGPMPRWCGSW